MRIIFLFLILLFCYSENLSARRYQQYSEFELCQCASLRMENTIKPNEELSKLLYKDIKLIRNKYQSTIPKLADIHIECNNQGIAIYFEDSIKLQYLYYPLLDSINMLFHGKMKYNKLIDPNSYSIRFDSIINTNLLVGIYEQLPSVDFAMVLLPFGEPESDIFPRRINLNERSYLFYKGDGDCPSGCIDRQYWYFEIDGDSVNFQGSWSQGEDPPCLLYTSEAETV